MADFEKASRLKLRFDGVKGLSLLSVEDLWDLPLTAVGNRTNLDDIAKDLHRQLKNDDVSFVEKAKKSNETIQLKFDVVKHVIDTKLAENEAIAERRDRKAKKERIMEILARREDQTLEHMPIEELRKALSDL